MHNASDHLACDYLLFSECSCAHSSPASYVDSLLYAVFSLPCLVGSCGAQHFCPPPPPSDANINAHELSASTYLSKRSLEDHVYVMEMFGGEVDAFSVCVCMRRGPVAENKFDIAIGCELTGFSQHKIVLGHIRLHAQLLIIMGNVAQCLVVGPTYIGTRVLEHTLDLDVHG